MLPPRNQKVSAFVWTIVICLSSCASPPRKIFRQIELDKTLLSSERYLEATTRKLNAERVFKKRRITPRLKVPLIKLHPIVEDDSTQTIADSTDEWMHFYYEGLSQIAEEQYDNAVSEFKQFIQTDPDHVYADRAFYWIVESYYRNKELGLCVNAANEFMQRFPGSVKAPDVLYRRALAFRQMGKHRAARENLIELVRRHPDSPLVDKANATLAKIMDGAKS